MSREHDQETGFLSRWSKRKLTPPEERTTEKNEVEVKVPEPETAPEQAPAHEDELPLWQRDDVDDELKKQALRALFRKPEFNQLDHLNEYDNDFTQFAKLGDIVTHDMKRMLKLAEQKTRPQEPTNKAGEQQQADNDTEDKEDDRTT